MESICQLLLDPRLLREHGHQHNSNRPTDAAKRIAARYNGGFLDTSRVLYAYFLRHGIGNHKYNSPHPWRGWCWNRGSVGSSEIASANITCFVPPGRPGRWGPLHASQDANNEWLWNLDCFMIVVLIRFAVKMYCLFACLFVCCTRTNSWCYTKTNEHMQVISCQ